MWKWKTDPADRTRLGLVAQEVQTVLPELIEQGTDKDRLLGMNYLGLLPVVIRAIQQQQESISSIRNELAALQRRNTHMANKTLARPSIEVSEVEPLLTMRNDKGEIEGGKYQQLNVELINAVKEQKARIEQQQRQLQQQQTVIDGLRKLLCQNNPRAEVCKESATK